MKHQTPKRAAIERAIRKAKREVKETRPEMCEGCGTCQGPIDMSHHIKVDYEGYKFAADPNNIAKMCRAKCHGHVEAGRYELLDNGESIMAYIRHVAPEYLERKLGRRDMLKQQH